MKLRAYSGYPGRRCQPPPRDASLAPNSYSLVPSLAKRLRRRYSEYGNRIGQEAQVKIDGSPEKTFSGKLTFISPVAEFTPKTVETRELRVDLVYRIKVEVNDPDGTLKIGMPADIILAPAKS